MLCRSAGKTPHRDWQPLDLEDPSSAVLDLNEVRMVPIGDERSEVTREKLTELRRRPGNKLASKDEL